MSPRTRPARPGGEESRERGARSGHGDQANTRGRGTMLTLINLMLPLFQKARNERGVVSVEWIILGAVIMAAIVLAFAPTFSGALTSAVTAISNQLQSNVAAA